MRKNKPMIFWLFAMRETEQEGLRLNIEDFDNAGVRFITIDFDDEKNSFVITVYNMTKTESKPYVDEIYQRISKSYNVSKKVGVL